MEDAAPHTSSTKGIEIVTSWATTRWNPNLHPRGTGGRFVDQIGEFAPDADFMMDQRNAWQQPARSIDPGVLGAMYRRGSLFSGRPYTSTERERINEYLQGSEINNQLRDPYRPFDHNTVDDPDQYVADMDRAIAANRTSADTLVYRGIDPSLIEGLRAKDELRDRGYMSTSLDPNMTHDFGSAMLEIEVPAGTPVAFNDGIDTTPWIMDQREVILPRGSHLRVRQVQQIPAWDGSTRTVVTAALELTPEAARRVGLED